MPSVWAKTFPDGIVLSQKLHSVRDLVAFSQAFAQLLYMCVEYGFQLSATRELAAHRDSREHRAVILSEVNAAKFLLLCVVATAAIVTLRANPHFHSHPLLLLSALIWMAGQSANMGWFYQAIERLRPALIADLSAGLISSAAILALVKRPEDGWKVLLLQGCASLGTAAFAFCWALVGSGVVRPAWSGIVARLRSGRHVFGFRFALGIYSFGNPFILGWSASATAVGHYSGAEKIARALPLMVYPLAQAVFPRVSRHAYAGSEKANRIAVIALIVAASAGLLGGLTALIGAPVLVRVLLGDRFRATVQILRVLSLLCPLVSMNTVLAYHWLLPRFLDASLTRLTVIGGVLNICFSLLFAPRFGAVGMAWAVVCTEAFVFAGYMVVLSARFRASS
jgi:PST family polysaccharide transporter